MENIKISSKVSQKVKKVLVGIAVGFLVASLILLLATYITYCSPCPRSHHAGPYAFKHKVSDCSAAFWHYVFWGINIYICFAFAFISLVLFLLWFCMICKIQITVTDKRVYGKTYFGRRVDLPIDSISAIGSSMFNGIAVATSSGKISFAFIENSQLVREEILNLLVLRQEEKKKESSPALMQTSNVDELKKYKELLDSGIISQEEFDQKKKQLLGL